MKNIGELLRIGEYYWSFGDNLWSFSDNYWGYCDNYWGYGNNFHLFNYRQIHYIYPIWDRV